VVEIDTPLKGYSTKRRSWRRQISASGVPEMDNFNTLPLLINAKASRASWTCRDVVVDLKEAFPGLGETITLNTVSRGLCELLG
jgi:hypothetical protein